MGVILHRGCSVRQRNGCSREGCTWVKDPPVEGVELVTGGDQQVSPVPGQLHQRYGHVGRHLQFCQQCWGPKDTQTSISTYRQTRAQLTAYRGPWDSAPVLAGGPRSGAAPDEMGVVRSAAGLASGQTGVSGPPDPVG